MHHELRKAEKHWCITIATLHAQLQYQMNGNPIYIIAVIKTTSARDDWQFRYLYYQISHVYQNHR